MLARAPSLAALVSLACLSVGGCRKHELPAADEVSQPEGQPIPAAPADLQQMLSTLGDRGLFVVIMRDVGWRESVGPLLERTGLGSSVEPAGRSPLGLLHRLLETLEIPVGTGELRGRDANRPIVASLFEPPIDGAMTAATALQPLRADAHIGMREQVLIPASDPAALLESLGERFADLERWPELVAGRSQAQSWRFPGGFVAALSEGELVRVVVSHGASGLDTVEDLPQWRAQLDSSPATPVDTPALRHFGQADASLAVLLRPWRVRAAFSWDGLHYGRLALQDAPPDRREEVIARATALVLGGELLMPDEGAEFDDWAVTVTHDDGIVRVRAVGSATEVGQRVLAAARVDAPLDSTFGALKVGSWVSFDEAMAAATGSPTSAIGNVTSAEAIDLWRHCGLGCPIYASLRMPFGAAKSPIGGQLRLDLLERLEGALSLSGSVRVAAAGPALAIELVLGDSSQLAFSPDFAGMQWSSPLRAAAVSPGDACIARAGLGVQRALSVLVEAEPERRASLLSTSVSAIEDDLRCASEHPPTASAAAALRRMVIEAAVDAELASVAFDRAQALLEQACTQHADAQLCALEDLLAAAPKPALVSVPNLEACDAALDRLYWRPGELNGLPLYVTSTGIALGVRSLARDKQAIAAAVAERSLDEAAPLALVVDRAVELRTLAPVFEAFAALEIDEFALVTRDDRGHIYSVPMQFRGTKTFDVELPTRARSPEDEPPPEVPSPEDEPPPPRKNKSGLYDMMGPKDPIPQLDRGDRRDATVLALDGKSITLTPARAASEKLTLEQLAGRLEEGSIELRVSPATPWSSVVTLATSVCPLTLTLDQSSE